MLRPLGFAALRRCRPFEARQAADAAVRVDAPDLNLWKCLSCLIQLSGVSVDRGNGVARVEPGLA